MKLLLDQNLSFRLVKKLEAIFTGTEQVKRLGLQNKPDKEIWDFARREEFIIVTFDSDFYDLSLVHGHPPKLIWIKSRNATTKNVEKLLIERADQIRIFIGEPNLSCLEIID